MTSMLFQRNVGYHLKSIIEHYEVAIHWFSELDHCIGISLEVLKYLLTLKYIHSIRAPRWPNKNHIPLLEFVPITWDGFEPRSQACFQLLSKILLIVSSSFNIT